MNPTCRALLVTAFLLAGCNDFQNHSPTDAGQHDVPDGDAGQNNGTVSCNLADLQILHYESNFSREVKIPSSPDPQLPGYDLLASMLANVRKYGKSPESFEDSELSGLYVLSQLEQRRQQDPATFLECSRNPGQNAWDVAYCNVSCYEHDTYNTLFAHIVETENQYDISIQGLDMLLEGHQEPTLDGFFISAEWKVHPSLNRYEWYRGTDPEYGQGELKYYRYVNTIETDYDLYFHMNFRMHDGIMEITVHPVGMQEGCRGTIVFQPDDSGTATVEDRINNKFYTFTWDSRLQIIPQKKAFDAAKKQGEKQ